VRNGLARAALLCVIAIPSTGAQTEQWIYSFTGGDDGAHPAGNLIADKQGNLYGTTSAGGVASCGTVFELARSKSHFTFSVIWTFERTNSVDGCRANGDLVMDAAGSLYGTTSGGGTYASQDGKGGTVFQLVRASDGAWTETLLWSFGGMGDGSTPRAGLAIDPSGNLYGVTSEGGACCGTVFELEKASGWTEMQIRVFGREGGARPETAPILDTRGNLYGTAHLRTGSGGSGNMVYRMIETVAGWKLVVVHRGPEEPVLPFNLGMAFRRGRYYGVKAAGGAFGHGAIVDRTRTGAESVLYSFAGPPKDGERPNGVIAGAGGRLYGTAAQGGAANAGGVFEIRP
jgi:uncharacterized repeat protein (TIGR03803 family)